MPDLPGGRSDAGLGVAATSVALLITLAIFPANPAPAGALTIPAAVLSAGILFLPITRLIRRAPTDRKSTRLNSSH